jgi:hypothetical protein
MKKALIVGLLSTFFTFSSAWADDRGRWNRSGARCDSRASQSYQRYNDRRGYDRYNAYDNRGRYDYRDSRYDYRDGRDDYRWRDRDRSTGASVGIIAGSAGGGAAIGAMTGGLKGAAIGAIVGGAAGAVYDQATRNNDNRRWRR